MKFHIFLITLIPSLSIASVPTGCGEYSLKGIVRSQKDEMAIIVNEKTLSQHLIKFPIEEQSKLGAYLDKEVSASIIIEKKFDGMNASAEKILTIKSRLPDPLNPQDTELVQKTKVKCL